MKWVALTLVFLVTIVLTVLILGGLKKKLESQNIYSSEVHQNSNKPVNTSMDNTDSTSACSRTFNIGDDIKYSVVDGTRTRLRAGPSSDTGIVAMIPEKEFGVIIGGPVCNNYVWWKIRVNGYEGWTTDYTPKDGWLLEKR